MRGRREREREGEGGGVEESYEKIKNLINKEKNRERVIDRDNEMERLKQRERER